MRIKLTKKEVEKFEVIRLGGHIILTKRDDTFWRNNQIKERGLRLSGQKK